MVTISPFATDDSLVGVACGMDNNGQSIFVAVSQTHYSTSYNGEDWTDAVYLSDGIQGVFYGGGYFLIPDVQGNIWRSDWTSGLIFLQQETSQNVTMGIVSIAYLQNKFIGVGINNRIVGASDPAYWNEEQSPAPADSQWNSVFAGNGFFVTVGNYGRALKGTIAGVWTALNIGTTEDLHFGIYESFSYIVTGKNGALRTSSDASAWVARASKTTSTIRAAGYFTERFFVGTDSGQLIVSASVKDVLTLDSEKTGTGPSNDLPMPISGSGDPGSSNNYLRSDAVIPDTGVVMESRVGIATTYKTVDSVIIVDRYGIPYLNEETKIPVDFMPWQRGEPNGVASLNETGIVPDEELNKNAPNGVAGLDENTKIPDELLKIGVPNGIAPLGADNIVPEIHLPAMEINVNEIVNVINSGIGLKFLEQISPFPKGVGVSSIIHGGTFGKGIYVLVGEAGIGWSDNLTVWQLSDTQPFNNVPVVSSAFGKDDKDNDIFITIDTENHYSISRNGKSWGARYDFDYNYDFEAITYYNRTFIILCSNGEILHSVFNNGNLTGWNY
jgi:hypothetical protein